MTDRVKLKPSPDVIVIGAGIIGSSIAFRLAKEGLRVTVVERGRPGEEASMAAAGMLAPQAEAAHSAGGAFAELCLASLSLYPDFVAEIEAETGMKIDYDATGSLFVATDYVEAEALAGLYKRQRAAGQPAEELSADQVRELEPALSESIQLGVYLPNDHHVDNRRLMTALVAAASGRGVVFQSGTPATGLMVEKDRIVGVHVPGQTLPGRTIINAAGCWAGLVDQSDRIRLPVRPVRGQMLCLERRPQPLHHLIHSTGCYLVPWPDGRILVGATVENVGYNKDVTAGGIGRLLTAVLNVAPSLASAPIREVWAGLRPDTVDNLPLLGPGPIPHLVVAAGHFRNGILLAPITAQLISELILSGQPSMSLDPFSPHRFQ